MDESARNKFGIKTLKSLKCSIDKILQHKFMKVIQHLTTRNAEVKEVHSAKDGTQFFSLKKIFKKNLQKNLSSAWIHKVSNGCARHPLKIQSQYWPYVVSLDPQGRQRG